jgi:hypothetical protein
MDNAPRSSKMSPAAVIPGVIVLAVLIGLIGWVSLGEKPNATAQDPQTRSAGQQGSVPAARAGGPSDPRIGTSGAK